MKQIFKLSCVFSILFFLYSKNLSAQVYNIAIKFETPPAKVYISGIYVDQFKLIDSVEVKNNIANIKIDKKTMPANYQLLSKKPRTQSDFDQEKCFYLYFENENIQIFSPDKMVNKTTAIVKKGDKLKDYLAVEKASEKYQREMFKAFKRVNMDNKNRIEPDLKSINANLDSQHKVFSDKYKAITDRNSANFTAITNLLCPMHFHLKKDKNQNRLSAIKAFEHLYVFNNDALMFTPLFKEKLSEYMDFFQTRFLTYEQSSQELIKVIDQLLEMTKTNKTIQSAAMKQFLFYIRRFSYDEVILAFDNKYFNNIKETKETKYLDYIIKPYRETAPGTQAKNIVTKDINGKTFDLSKVKSKYTVLLFFSSTCSHCRKELPLIKSWYNSIDKSKLKFVSISIDSNEKQWRDFLAKGKYPFTEICDFKSWDSPFVKGYNIHGTPSMIVLDENKIIQKKIVQIDDLKSYFKDKF